MSEFPEHAWMPWGFTKMQLWWARLAKLFAAGDQVALATVRLFIEDLAHNFPDLDQLPHDHKHSPHVKYLGGITFIKHRLRSTDGSLWNCSFGSSSYTLKAHRSPDTDQTTQYPLQYWLNKENRSAYMERLKMCLGGQLEELYQLRPIHFTSTGGV